MRELVDTELTPQMRREDSPKTMPTNCDKPARTGQDILEDVQEFIQWARDPVEAVTLLPPTHLSPREAVISLILQGSDEPLDLALKAYDLGYQAAVLNTQARAVEHGARGGGKRSRAQQRQTARLNGTPLTPTSASAPRQAPGNPWTEEEDAAVLRGEFPETHTRGACYARRSRLRRGRPAVDELELSPVEWNGVTHKMLVHKR